MGSPRISVLVLDDDAAIRAALREALEPEFIVLEARDGAEALASSRLVHPAIVLMDLRLPGGMTGQEFVKEYRRDGGHARLLLFTADPDARELARGLHADGVIEKPFDLDDLVGTLLGTAMLFPLGFLEQGYRDVPTWSGQSWLAAAFLGVISTFVAFLIFFWAVRRFGASRGALISYLAPVAALFIAFVVLGERPFPLQLVGAVVILAGVRLVTRKTPAVVPSSRPAPA